MVDNRFLYHVPGFCTASACLSRTRHCEKNLHGGQVIARKFDILESKDLRQKFANQIVIAAGDGAVTALAAARYGELRKDREPVPGYGLTPDDESREGT